MHQESMHFVLVKVLLIPTTASSTTTITAITTITMITTTTRITTITRTDDLRPTTYDLRPTTTKDWRLMEADDAAATTITTTTTALIVVLGGLLKVLPSLARMSNNLKSSWHQQGHVSQSELIGSGPSRKVKFTVIPWGRDSRNWLSSLFW